MPHQQSYRLEAALCVIRTLTAWLTVGDSNRYTSWSSQISRFVYKLIYPTIFGDLLHDSMKVRKQFVCYGYADNFWENMWLIEVIPNLKIN